MFANTFMEINEAVLKVKEGELEAFGYIYDSFAQRIFKYVRIKIQNRQEAEDILQEVFVKAYQAIPKLSMKDLNFAAWLYRVTSNTINDHFRKRYRSQEVLGLDDNLEIQNKQNTEAEYIVKSDFKTVRDAFAKLSPLYRQVLELRFVQEFSVSEVAVILCKSKAAVRIIQYRALKKTQKILSDNNFYA